MYKKKFIFLIKIKNFVFFFFYANYVQIFYLLLTLILILKRRKKLFRSGQNLNLSWFAKNLVRYSQILTDEDNFKIKLSGIEWKLSTYYIF